MDLTTLLEKANPDFLIFVFSSLVAFLSWLLKSLIEKPIAESKKTFNKYLEKRIEFLSEIKTRLVMISYFPKGKDSLEFKNQIQSLLLKDGKAAYLNKSTFDKVLRISIDPCTNHQLLLSTIAEIDIDLQQQISKIQDEIRFYRHFSNFNPFKRFLSLALLISQYIIAILLIAFGLYFLVSFFLSASNFIKIFLFVFAGLGLYYGHAALNK